MLHLLSDKTRIIDSWHNCHRIFQCFILFFLSRIALKCSVCFKNHFSESLEIIHFILFFEEVFEIKKPNIDHRVLYFIFLSLFTSLFLIGLFSLPAFKKRSDMISIYCPGSQINKSVKLM